MTRRRNPETLLSEAIEAALAWEQGLLLWRVNSGVFGARHVRAGLGTGCADLVGVLGPSGRMVALEVKMPDGEPTKAQIEWAGRVRARGAFACVVRSVDEARAAIARARKGATQ